MIFIKKDLQYINLSNANYIGVTEQFPGIYTKKVYSVYALFGERPGYRNEGAVVKDGFKSIDEAFEWIEEILNEKDNLA